MRPLLPLVLLLSACASVPATTWLDPAPVAITQSITTTAVWLTFTDGRSDDTVMVLENARISGDPSLAPRIQNLVRQGFMNKGYVLTPQGSTKLSITLKELESRVDKSTFKHQARQRVVLEAVAERDDHMLTRTFTSRGTFEAPLGVDVGRLEAELNKVLEQGLNNLVNDPELGDFFRP